MYRHHGGRVARNVLDFSVPVNPLGPPKQLVELLKNSVEVDIDIILRYPDYEYEDLRKAIAEFYGIDRECVVPLNGAAEALYIVLAVYKPRNLIVVEPTFGDYRAASQVLGVPLVSVHYLENLDTFEFPLESLLTVSSNMVRDSVILLSNPNNPTGCFTELKHLEEVARTFKRSLLLVDEAFIDLSERSQENSLSLVEGYDNVIIVRSLTKSFSVPGLRIGFMYANYGLSRAFNLYRQPWNVNSLANYLFVKLLSEFRDEVRIFLESSRLFISSEKGKIASRLKKLGFYVYRSYAPFILVRSHSLSAEEINSKLMKYNIYVRDASSYTPLTKYFFRIAIKKEEENEYFINVMSKILGEGDEHS